MRRVYVLVEGPSDAAFLRRILPKEDAKLAKSSTRAGVPESPSLARSLLVRRKCPVAVVMDSDSVDPDVIEERQQGTEDLIRAADSVHTRQSGCCNSRRSRHGSSKHQKRLSEWLDRNLSEEWLSLATRS